MKLSLRFLLLSLFTSTVVFFIYFWQLHSKDSARLKQTRNNAFQPKILDQKNVPESHVQRAETKGGQALEQTDKKKSVFVASERVQHLPCSNGTSRIPDTVSLNTFNLLHTLDSFYDESWVTEVESGKQKIIEKMIGNEQKAKEIQEPLEVIVLPHSHSDPGWLKSLEDYFEDQTRHVLDFMLEKLTMYPDMTFVWAESVFLSLWWKGLNDVDKKQVKLLIERNQLEIAVGSWVVPDEANPSLFGLIDQMIEGHQWLEHNLGVKPTNTWSLDPFGYSATLPYLYKRAGFKNMIILRVHQFLKAYLENSQNLEFVWRQSWDKVGTSTDIFTTMLPYALYNIKHQCGPDQDVCLKFDFRKIPMEFSEANPEPVTNENVKKLAKLLIHEYKKKNNLYKHNVVLVPLGDDFRYDRNVEWDQQYGNYTRLFRYINERPELNVNIRFGTLNDYFDLVHKAIAKNNISISTLEGDFLPYTDRSEDYWTGYFTSRAFDKNYGREMEQYLRAAEILNVLARITGPKSFKHYAGNLALLADIRQALALFQHHDGITGTARAYVVIDFEQRLFIAMKQCKTVIAQSMQYLMAKDKAAADNYALNVEQPKSLFLTSPTKTMVEMQHGTSVVVVFNPIAQEREEIIRLSIGYDNVEVLDSKGNPVLCQVNPLWSSSKEIYKNAFELVFIANLAPLSLTRFRIVMKHQTVHARENVAAFLSFSNMEPPKFQPDMRFKVHAPKTETITLQNDYIRARFSAWNGLLQSVTTKTKLASTDLKLETLMYKSRRSGAYIFYPTGPATDSEMLNSPPIRVIIGPVVSEIHVIQRDTVVTHIVRLYNCSGILGSVLEVVNIANLTKFDDHELVMRVTVPDMESKKGVFYTDLNGLQTMKRRRFKRFPRQANYYPMTSFAFIEDSIQRLNIICAQPLGVSSQEENSLEVMLDRRLLYDDGRGIGEGVRDTKITPSRFFLLLEKRSSSFEESNQFSSPKDAEKHDRIDYRPSLQVQLLANQLQHHSIVTWFDPDDAQFPVDSAFSQIYAPLPKPFPCDLVLVNLRAIQTPAEIASMSEALPMEGNAAGQNAGTRVTTKAALILHRYGSDCEFPLMGFQCNKQGESNKLVLSSMFKQMTPKQATEMSLSLMYDIGPVDTQTELDLKEMEVYVYKLEF